MTARPPIAVVIPTTGRPDYVEVALRSILPQARRGGAEVLVVDDGEDPRTRTVAARLGADYRLSPPPGGLNAARNAGVQATTAPLVVFVDDDVEVGAGWLESYLTAATRLPEYEVFGGPIQPRLEEIGRASCRERV